MSIIESASLKQKNTVKTIVLSIAQKSTHALKQDWSGQIYRPSKILFSYLVPKENNIDKDQYVSILTIQSSSTVDVKLVDIHSELEAIDCLVEHFVFPLQSAGANTNLIKPEFESMLLSTVDYQSHFLSNTIAVQIKYTHD